MERRRWMPIAVSLILGVVCGSCSSSKSDEETSDRKVVTRPEAFTDPVPANQCRIVATVLEVHGPRRDAGQDELCSRFPCAASVRVDSILGYGSGFQGALGPGQTIDIDFLYTLAPSSEALPESQFSLPGLSAGDRFQADITSGQETLDRDPKRFSVALYSVRPRESHIQ